VTSVSKLAGLLLIAILILSSLTIVGSVFAQSISKPSVPDFTVKAVANTLEITIKNQPLTSYENGSYPSLYYGFRFKDHDAGIGFWDYDPIYFVLPSTYGGYYKASDSDSTVVSLSLEGYHFPSGQIDIQAFALVGNQYPTNMQNGTVYGFEGVISGWSNTQTITIPTSLEPIEIILPVILIVIVIGVGLLVYFKKRHHTKINKPLK
jgi:hypothetical protein